MNTKSDNPSTGANWFVGASFGGTDDQVPRFLSEGIWENGYDDEKHLNIVRSMRPGERIAIKSTYTRKHGLPFDNRGHTVSVMDIKAVGTIRENLNDGKRVRVDWTPVEPVREWYFYTYRPMIWRVLPGEWATDALIAFTFDDKLQDLERFRNHPFWSERFGTIAPENLRFGWTNFYEAIANKLLDYRENRSALVEGIREISERVDGLGYLNADQYDDDSSGFIRDICPFTTMGLFNRGTTDANRKIIATELRTFLGVEEEVPQTFEGIPFLNNLRSLYFPFEIDRAADQIDDLWDIFASAIGFADSEGDDDIRDVFAESFDRAIARPWVAWNLTFGLYWIRPWAFLSLDTKSRVYLSEKLRVPIGLNGPDGRCNSSDYLAVMDTLESRFQEDSYPVHSYPELSLEAWLYKPPESGSTKMDVGETPDDGSDTAPPIVPYALEDILKDGCFLEWSDVELLLERLRTKKNVILQGPPGTGKTWLAKRLAFALIGEKDDSKVRAVQFHANLSYEDFVRGWRPTGEGKLTLADGVFMEAIKAAAKDPASKFVVVIEEINRGNPAHIFGELLTLLEAGKRSPSEALELCYPDADGTRRPVHIPENLYVIGTMNIADRSLALVDFALRRRFAFVELEPVLGRVWRDWVVKECAVDPSLAEDIGRRISALNDDISKDPRLGKQFRVGHSYVTPAHRLEQGDTRKWFKQIAETEIGPLLDEYWFDAPEEAERQTARLTQGW